MLEKLILAFQGRNFEYVGQVFTEVSHVLELINNDFVAHTKAKDIIIDALISILEAHRDKTPTIDQPKE